MTRLTLSALVLLLLAWPSLAELQRYEYRVLATNKTSTMERELNQAAEDGYVFRAVMGGETAFGGSQTVIVMARTGSQPGTPPRYRLLATNKTSTMQKEMRQFAADGYRYRGQTIFEFAFDGREVTVIMELLPEQTGRYDYNLLATSKTSTMEKELRAAGEAGYELLGMTVAETAFAGPEVVCILERRIE